jgi:hypothetical protein
MEELRENEIPGLALLFGFVLCLTSTDRTKSRQQQQEMPDVNIRAYVELLRSDLRTNERKVISAVMQSPVSSNPQGVWSQN